MAGFQSQRVFLICSVMRFQMSSLVFMSSSIAQKLVTSERLALSGCMNKEAVVLEQMIPCLPRIEVLREE